MLHFIYLGRYHGIPKYWNCVGFVLIRAFGLGSGCVAFIMAFERWLALTRPFLYHQVFTYQILKRLLCGLWLTAVILTYLPLFGFGLYYNKDKNECDRFRYAVEVKDKIYAYLFFAFGATLCICIALCNVAVICELLRIRSQQKVLVRRISKAIIVNRDRPGCPARYHTDEENAFAKLMGFICLIFIVCWAPQVELLFNKDDYLRSLRKSTRVTECYVTSWTFMHWCALQAASNVHEHDILRLNMPV
ncbi:unnamed protein product [Callosobruchus maculatus]|uniref:G-protein coupled receptors family 1 profile domain-containing protein n=1 Tax=Callosobruchus maculatus TaxID=64391 RepID=A0A653BL69_CALMS|nr:unnamed protein product [Callosobruchus maculatus]